MAYNTTSTYLTEGLVPINPGIIYGQHARLDELNTRLFDRVLPNGGELQPNFDPRPVSTKYTVFPTLAEHIPPMVPIRQIPEYSTKTTFAPMTTRGPVDGFFTNVDTESLLRSQFFALQNGAGQHIYIPSSQSDLYRTPAAVGRQETQPYENLFKKESYIGPSNTHLGGIGQNMFSNHTRSQMRNEYIQTSENHIFI
jgi:hypothetical protein